MDRIPRQRLQLQIYNTTHGANFFQAEAQGLDANGGDSCGSHSTFSMLGIYMKILERLDR
jgi:hypothetical protein